MKFAEHLASHITPEWRKQYLLYEAFKDMLYAAQDQAPSIEGKDPHCLDKQTQTHRRTEALPDTLICPLFGHPQNNNPSSAKNRFKLLLTCCHTLRSVTQQVHSQLLYHYFPLCYLSQAHCLNQHITAHKERENSCLFVLNVYKGHC
ncbi:hypothetical protein AMECASPLE_032232 [Ameca splendens]|uniref:SPX domain-containing protein n=1 Tax=Ameca splendens TaxID=208324 RepID=A0ABV0XVF4_9TELE